jgi:hypothetical protein
MVDSTFGVFLLDITKEDVQRSEASKIFGITKNVVAESLWRHSAISLFLVHENKVAVEYITRMKQEKSLDEYCRAIIYHLKKRVLPVLTCIQNELGKALVIKATLVSNNEQVIHAYEIIHFLNVFADELYTSKPLTQRNLHVFSDDLYAKGLFQLWLLMYKLAEKENVNKEILKEASFALQVCVRNLHI